MRTQHQEEIVQQRLSEFPKALKRDPNVGYTQGYFFVTLNVHDHLPILGNMVGSYQSETKQVLNAGVRLTQLGESVLRCWNQIPEFHPNVELIDAQVMPEHFHGLLRLNYVKGQFLGKIINGFMVGCTHAYWDILGISWKDMNGRTDGEADKQWTDWQHKVSYRGPSLFSAGFNETTPITEEDVATKIQYIRTNPERRIIKGAQRDCFTIYRQQTSANWTIERVRHGLMADYAMRSNPDRLEEGWQSVSPQLLRTDDSTNEALTLSYVGPRDLLLISRKLPLVCHSIDEPIRQQQMEAIIHEAQSGAVIVSAFISRREREIKDMLLQQGCPIIEIIDNGMSGVYKPWGKAFYYCAEGRLLQITPWKYLYQKDFTITRPMCMVMNELARLISGVEDDWWKK